MTTPTCTVRSAVTGVCGKPAVHVFTSSRGETFAECAEHHLPTTANPENPWTPLGSSPAPRSVTLVHPVTGNKVRTVSGRRFIVVADFTGNKAVVVIRTNNLPKARRIAADTSSAVVFDRITKEVTR